MGKDCSEGPAMVVLMVMAARCGFRSCCTWLQRTAAGAC